MYEHEYTRTFCQHNTDMYLCPDEEIEITFSYWDGSGHRKTVKVIQLLIKMIVLQQ